MQAPQGRPYQIETRGKKRTSEVRFLSFGLEVEQKNIFLEKSNDEEFFGLFRE